VVSIKWLDPDSRGTPPAHLFVVKSVIVTPGPLAVGDRAGRWWSKEEDDAAASAKNEREREKSDDDNDENSINNNRHAKEWRIEEVVEWGEENALIVRNCPKGATLKFKVIAYGAFGASKAATTNEVKIPSGRDSSSLGVRNENSSDQYYNSGVNQRGRNNNAVVEEPPQTFLSMFWSAMAILASTGGVFVRLYYLARSWKRRNDYKNDVDGGDGLAVNGSHGTTVDAIDASIIGDGDDVSVDATVGIAAKSPQKAVSALIKRAEKQLLDSSRELMEPEAEPPSPKVSNQSNGNAARMMIAGEEDAQKVVYIKTTATPPRSASPQLNVTSSAETTPSKAMMRKAKRNGSSSSLLSLNASSPAKPTSSAQSQTTTTSGSTGIKKGICADPSCSKKVKGLFKSPNAHYCGFCQHKFCFSHVATSPHGARGKCMPESECVCLKCFDSLDEKKQKSLLKNLDVLQKPEILEQMARKEKAAKRWKMIKNVVKVSRMAEKRMAYTRAQQQM